MERLTLNAFNGEIDEEINSLKEMIENINTQLENLAAQVVRMDDRFSAAGKKKRDEEEEPPDSDGDDDPDSEFICVGVDLVLEGQSLKLKKKKIVAKPFVDKGQEAEENLDDFEDCDDATVPVEPCP
jgi:predicted ribosome quality control (RQC) complex YloA/Tae2 family protein